MVVDASEPAADAPSLQAVAAACVATSALAMRFDVETGTRWVLLAQATVAADVVAVQPLAEAGERDEVRRVELEPFGLYLDLVFGGGPAGARCRRVAVRRHALSFLRIVLMRLASSAAVWCAASHCSQRVLAPCAAVKLAAMASRAAAMRLHLCAYATLDTASDGVYDAALTSKPACISFLRRCAMSLILLRIRPGAVVGMLHPLIRAGVARCVTY